MANFMRQVTILDQGSKFIKQCREEFFFKEFRFDSYPVLPLHNMHPFFQHQVIHFTSPGHAWTLDILKFVIVK